MYIDIDQRVQQAINNFHNGYNCSQSVFLAYADLYNLDPVFAATISAPLGGGMGRLREVCGAVSAMFLVSGLAWPAPGPNDKAAKTRSYTIVQELAGKFRDQNGSIVCRELLGLDQQSDTPVPSDRTPRYYKKRPCAEYVGTAARLIAEKLNMTE